MTSALQLATKIIAKWEGCRLSAYPDPATGGDPWTIGYGATGPGIEKGVTWTQEQADARLAKDVREFQAKVYRLLKRDPTDHQLAAMTSLAYNVGLGNFGGSTLLRKFNAGDVVGASEQFTRWNRANGRVMTGLSRRRAAESRLFEGSDP